MKLKKIPPYSDCHWYLTRYSNLTLFERLVIDQCGKSSSIHRYDMVKEHGKICTLFRMDTRESTQYVVALEISISGMVIRGSRSVDSDHCPNTPTCVVMEMLLRELYMDLGVALIEYSLNSNDPR